MVDVFVSTIDGAVPATRGGAFDMTDSFELDARPAADAVADSEINILQVESFDSAQQDEALAAGPVVAAEPEPEVPNGFVELGLAPELVAAVASLGYT
ncbi:MAG: ATP-dependent helicase, partial [Hyphomicrobiales bacterium]